MAGEVDRRHVEARAEQRFEVIEGRGAAGEAVEQHGRGGAIAPAAEGQRQGHR